MTLTLTTYTWHCSLCGGSGDVVAAPGQHVAALIREAHDRLPVTCKWDEDAVTVRRVAA